MCLDVENVHLFFKNNNFKGFKIHKHILFFSYN